MNTGLLTSLCSIGCLVSVFPFPSHNQPANDRKAFFSCWWLRTHSFTSLSSSISGGVRVLLLLSLLGWSTDLPKVHSNTMLAVLNAREGLRKAINEEDTSMDHIGTSAFKVWTVAMNILSTYWQLFSLECQLWGPMKQDRKSNTSVDIPGTYCSDITLLVPC